MSRPLNAVEKLILENQVVIMRALAGIVPIGYEPTLHSQVDTTKIALRGFLNAGVVGIETDLRKDGDRVP